ncbi:hypothetical protein D3C81_1801480 [compost metagenome]
MSQLRNQHSVHFFAVGINGINLLRIGIFLAVECPGAVEQYVIVRRQHDNIPLEIILVILHALPYML